MVLLLVVVVVVVVVLAVRGSRPGAGVPWAPPPGAPTPGTPPGTAPHGVGDLDETLTRWVDAGLLDRAQADAILAHEAGLVGARAAAVRRSRVPAVAEAIGYIGGVLAAAGVALLVGQAWSDLGAAGRIGVSVGGAAVLVGAGALVREGSDPAAARLRWLLWLLGSGLAGLAAGVVAVDVGDASGAPVVLAAAVAVAAVSGALWRGALRPPQQATALAAAVTAAGALVGVWADQGPVGLAVVVAGVVVLVLGLARRTTLPVLTVAVGALAMLVGSIVAATGWEGGGQLLILAVGLVLLGITQVPVVPADRPTLGVLATVGVLGLLFGGPSTLGWFAQEAGGPTGLATWAGGAVLLAVGLRLPVRTPALVVLLGGVGLLGGAAVTGAQWSGFAPLFGIVTSVALVAIGALPGAVLVSVMGALGLLGNVPWAIGHFFPGEGRAPLLVLVSGVLLVVVALFINRMSGRLRREVLDRPQEPTEPTTSVRPSA